MPRYILLTSLTPEGRKTLKERPYRMKEVDKEIESMGIKILSQYATLGPFDFVNVVEAPDNEAISKLSIELTSRGKNLFISHNFRSICSSAIFGLYFNF